MEALSATFPENVSKALADKQLGLPEVDLIWRHQPDARLMMKMSRMR